MNGPAMLLHADLNEQSFALRRQIVDDIAALPNASLHVWYEDSGGSKLSVTDVFAGMMDLSQVTLPDDAADYLWAGAVHAIDPKRADRSRGAPQDIQYEVFGPDLWQADTE